jgi:anti-anti-sigma factor
MSINSKSVEVYETGRLTVLGFGGREVLDHIDVAECRNEIAELVKENDCEVLAIDMTGVQWVPSGLLGLLASLRQLGVEVHIYNPSADVDEVLDITRLNRVITVHHIEM